MSEKRRFENEKEPDENLIFGRNAVAELLRSGRTVDKILIQRGQREGSITTIAATAKSLGVPVIDAEKQKLDRLCAGGVHQGVCAYASAVEYAELDDIFKKAEDEGKAPFIAVADGIEDRSRTDNPETPFGDSRLRCGKGLRRRPVVRSGRKGTEHSGVSA